MTTGGRLPARYVIHTVGPVYGQHGGAEARLLASCYRSAITLAAANELASLAFPAISTGIYGYPRDEAARVARSTTDSAREMHTEIREVRLVFFSEEDARVFLEVAR
jgi:O-acetyl-ADP-ribose deacetylase